MGIQQLMLGGGGPPSTPLVITGSNTMSGFGNGTEVSGYVETLPTNLAISGGTGAPITFSWVRISGNSGIGAHTPTALNTRFSHNSVNQLSPVTAIFRLTATDGTYTATHDVTVTLRYEQLN